MELFKNHPWLALFVGAVPGLITMELLLKSSTFLWILGFR